MDDAPPPQVWPTLRARDARGLIRFLCEAFGFEEVVTYGEGEQVDHAQLAWPLGGGLMLGSARDKHDDPWPLVPGSFGAYVVTDDTEALHVRAVAAGARSSSARTTPTTAHENSLPETPRGTVGPSAPIAGSPGPFLAEGQPSYIATKLALYLQPNSTRVLGDDPLRTGNLPL